MKRAGAIAIIIVISGGLAYYYFNDSKGPDLSDFNLILISMDDCRQDFWGSYGLPEPVTPFLDRLSRQSTIFTDVICQAPSTFFSHRSILISKYIHAQSKHIPKPAETLAGTLQKAGWRTGAFVDGGWMSGAFGHSAGFEVFNDEGKSLPQNINKAIKFIQSDIKRKFFVLLHGYDVHFPFKPTPARKAYFLSAAFPEASISMDSEVPSGIDPMIRDRAMYKGEIRDCDRTFEHLFIALERLGVRKKTVVILISDHGESMGERGYVGHCQLYNVQVKIPMMMVIPGQPPKLISDEAQAIDIMPTALSLLGVKAPPGVQGIDLKPLRSAHQLFPAGRPRLCETTDEAIQVDDIWRMIIHDNPADDELYRTDADPEENVNLIAQHPGKAAELIAAFEKLTSQSVSKSRTAEKPIYASNLTNRKRLIPVRGGVKDMTEKEFKQNKIDDELRALGYLE